MLFYARMKLFQGRGGTHNAVRGVHVEDEVTES